MLIYIVDLSDFVRKFIVLKKADIPLEYIIQEFLKKAKINPNKYAGNLFKSILTNFLNNIEDIEYNYERFYSLEYDSIEDYLNRKMLIEKEEIDYIFSHRKKGERIYYVDSENSRIGNYNSLFDYEEEDLLSKINNILEVIK